ncbi:hypothetical protein HJG60_009248 [Phyllostomus discolor]|uniref:Uncharacterized protein n=1 Tax=Phyllostomus discolor TaxID=89673 RepID=A0A833YMG1_9CHIR|nr:hypothetical protein HJG60_009248 [Phyllostomus discolor]
MLPFIGTEWFGVAVSLPQAELAKKREALKSRLQHCFKAFLVHVTPRLSQRHLSYSRRTHVKNRMTLTMPHTWRDQDGRAKLWCPQEHQHGHARHGRQSGVAQKDLGNSYQPPASLRVIVPTHVSCCPPFGICDLRTPYGQAAHTHQVFWILLVSLDQT